MMVYNKHIYLQYILRQEGFKCVLLFYSLFVSIYSKQMSQLHYQILILQYDNSCHFENYVFKPFSKFKIDNMIVYSHDDLVYIIENKCFISNY